MLIVGELINASRQEIKTAIEAGDADFIQQKAESQARAGADYLDVNAGVFGSTEAERLAWLVKTVQAAVKAPCCLDSPDPRAIEAALAVHDNSHGPAMINSISLEEERYQRLLPVIRGTDLKVVALCMSDRGMPFTSRERVAIAGELIDKLVQNRIPMENIFVDPLVQPLATKDDYAIEFLTAIEQIAADFKGVHTMCGLSNVSYGLPERKMLNQTFMVMAIAKGLDGAIVNPLDRRMMANIIAAESLMGRDEFCTKYLGAYRAGLFNS